MAFGLTNDDLKKSQLAPVGMHLLTLINVEESYLKDNGTEVQRVDFELESGHQIPYWFNSSFKGSLIEFIQAADNVVLTLGAGEERPIDLKDYIGKKVSGSVSHGKAKNSNKPVAQIDAFYPAEAIPF